MISFTTASSVNSILYIIHMLTTLCPRVAIKLQRCAPLQVNSVHQGVWVWSWVISLSHPIEFTSLHYFIWLPVCVWSGDSFNGRSVFFCQNQFYVFFVPTGVSRAWWVCRSVISANHKQPESHWALPRVAALTTTIRSFPFVLGCVWCRASCLLWELNSGPTVWREGKRKLESREEECGWRKYILHKEEIGRGTYLVKTVIKEGLVK